jgi:hypothetical protein
MPTKTQGTIDLPTSPLTLVSPFCNAQPGKDCETSDGGWAVVHVMRVRAAANADKARKDSLLIGLEAEMETIDDRALFESCSLLRGIFKRVGTKLNLDHSYVSRVANGQRNSRVVIKAIHEELASIRNVLNGTGKSETNTQPAPATLEK